MQDLLVRVSDNRFVLGWDEARETFFVKIFHVTPNGHGELLVVIGEGQRELTTVEQVENVVAPFFMLSEDIRKQLKRSSVSSSKKTMVYDDAPDYFMV